jgi:hypothetical protein
LVFVIKLHQTFSKLQRKIKKLPHPFRVLIGVLFLIGGLLWFLPILGLWMIPLGLLILSLDFPWARRGYLSIMITLRRWRDNRKAKQRKKNSDNR